MARKSGLTRTLEEMMAPEQVIAAPRQGGFSPARAPELPINQAQGRGMMTPEVAPVLPQGVRQEPMMAPAPQGPQMDTLGAQPTGIFPAPQGPVGAPVTAPVGFGTVSQTPQVPSMQSVGLNPLTTEPQFGGVAATPSLQPELAQPTFQPQAPAMGEEATRAALGGMFNEAPQSLAQVTAQDPASIAAQQASESFGMESAAREARLPEVGEFRERAVPDASNMRGERQYTDSQIRDLAGGDAEVMGRMKAMDEQGIDPATGKSRADAGLTFSEKLAQDKFNFDVDKFSYEQAKEAQGEAVAAQQSQDSAKFAARDMLRQHQNVMNKAQRAGKNIGFTTTGAVGALLGLAPGTKAYDQKATVETLQADAAFESLRKMREASKTGGALGQVSERELALLESAVGNLKTGQSGQQFKQNLNEYINMRNDAMLNVYDAFTADYGEANANEAFGIGSRDDLMGEGASQRGSGTAVESASGRYEVEVI